MQIKRWESPRREGRNDKGKGGSARRRQLKKQKQMLRQKLKQNYIIKPDSQSDNQHHNRQGEDLIFPLFFCVSHRCREKTLKLSLIDLVLR